LDEVISFVPATPLAIAPTVPKPPIFVPPIYMNAAMANPIIEANRLAVKRGGCGEVIIDPIQR
jgi:hypothetical protein